MKAINIQADPSTLEVGALNTTGVIYLSVEDVFFPEKNWNDFVFTVLSWWMKSADNLNKGLTSTEDFNFMDGPFKFNINKKGDKIYIKLFRRDKELYFFGPFSWSEFYESLHRTSRLCLDTYSYLTKQHSTDVETIAKLLEQAGR
jgi:hypothetical protein